jgi:trk system potassium uptake protein TrkA
MPTKKIAVIGIGHFGSAIARSLSKSGVEVMALDKDSSKIERIAEDVALGVAIDATDKKALLSQNIHDFDAVVIAIGQNFEERLLCCSVLLDLKIRRIIVRSMGVNQRSILEKLGISEIWSPEEEVGMIVAERLLNPSILNYLQLPDDYRVVEMITPKNTVGRTIGEINFRDKYRLSLITLKEECIYSKNGTECTEYHVAGVPDYKTRIKSTDRLVLFGKVKDIDRFLQINE